MYIIHVIPIARGVTQNIFTYFTTKRPPLGTLVSIPIRRKTGVGIVTHVEDVIRSKAKIKKADFTLRKIEVHDTGQLLLPEFITSTEELAHFTASSTGALLYSLIPKVLLDNRKLVALKNRKQESPHKNIKNEQQIIQAPVETRLENYKKLVREAFAKNLSVYICVPSVASIPLLYDKLAQGIETYTFVMHSGIKQSELSKRLQQLLTVEHPILIIGTGSFLAVPRADVGTIIVEYENSRAYKLQSRPFVDLRTFAAIYAKQMGIRIIFAGMPLRVETYFKKERGEYGEHMPTTRRVESGVDLAIIDMRTPPKEARGQSFSTLSKELRRILEEATKHSESVFIFNARKGIAATTVCEDCGNVVTCNFCNAPVVLHRHKDDMVFVCHVCGNSRSAKERCATCRSWKLKPLGVGLERVTKEVASLYPDRSVFVVSSDVTTTPTLVERAIASFYKTPGSILIGTEMALPHLTQQIPHCAVASLDSLLSLPDPRVHERVFSILLSMRSRAQKTFLIQTRQPNLPLITFAIRGAVEDFYHFEIKERKQFGFPPFTLLIKISVTGTRMRVVRDIETLKSKFSDYEFHVYPFIGRAAKGAYTLNGLIRIPSILWPDTTLLNLLRTLPPQVRVDIDPDNVL